MQKIEPLLHGQYYHIYNCGINGTPLFREPTNYEYFLRLYEKYVGPVADTYAWCLMGNHFHLLVRIKDEVDNIDNLNLTGFKNQSGLTVEKSKPLHQAFSNLFNAYSKAYNKMYTRHGSLFERPFKRKHIDNEAYLKQVVLYIHNNPVHHGFCNHPVEYAWSSFLLDTSDETEIKNRNDVMEWFGGKPEFDAAHNHNNGINDIENYLEG